MNETERTYRLWLFEHVSQAVAIVAVVIGVSVLIGWVFDIYLLKSVFPGLVAMKVNTAIAFIFAGISLWFFAQDNQSALYRRISQVCAGIVFLLGLLTMGEFLSGGDFGIDQLFIREITISPGDIPGRMALNTAISFSVIGGALLLLIRRKMILSPIIHILAILPIFLAGTSFIAYAYDIAGFLQTKFNYTLMALHTTIVFVLLGIGIINAHPDYPFRRIMSSDGAAGNIARFLLPAAIVFPFVTGWFILKWYQVGYVGTASGLALFAAANIIGLSILILWNTSIIYKTDTLRQRAEERVRENSLLVENAKDYALFIVDTQGNIRTWNVGAERIKGYKADEVIGRHFSCFYTEEDIKQDKPYNELKVAEIEGRFEDEGWRVKKDGTKFWANVVIMPIYDNAGNLFGFGKITRDITERKKAETEILKLNRIYRMLSDCNQLLVRTNNENELVSNICDMIVSDGGYQFVWVGYLQFDEEKTIRPMGYAGYEEGFLTTSRFGWGDDTYGQGPDGIAIRTGEYCIIGDMQENPRFVLWREEALKRGYASGVTFPLVAEGDILGTLTIYASVTQAFDDNEIKLLQELTLDLAFGIVTIRRRAEQKQAEELLAASEKRFRAIIEHAMDGFTLNDAEGSIQYASPAVERILGYDPAEVTPRINPAELTHPEDLPELLALLADLMQKPGKVVTTQYRFRHKNGSWRWIESTISNMLAEPGINAIIFNYHDITERKQAEEQIKRFNAELEAKVKERTAQLEVSNKELEAFTYSVSHDLRAPLRAIDGFSLAVLEDYSDKLDNENKHYLERVRNASQKMSELIDDLLNLSRLVRSDINKAKINLGELVSRILSELKESDPDREIEFDIRCNTLAEADPHLMEVVLTNLLNNSWKFTSKKDKAKIEFGCFKKDENEVYYIKDNGVGFNMNYANKLFQPFQRLHTDEEFPGTGIGLATVERVIKKHGGSVWAEGEVDKGATFYFNLQGGFKT